MTIGKLIPGGVAALVCVLGVAPVCAQNAPTRPARPETSKPVNTVLDPGVITTRQAIMPAGIQMVFGAGFTA